MAEPVLGLSPPARGNLVHRIAQALRNGPIPACAGEPVSKPCIHSAGRAYPRLRGGTSARWQARWRSTGLSPPARGNHLLVRKLGVLPGPIPACAGEPGASRPGRPGWRAYPRLRGGTPPSSSRALRAWGLSPPARGNHGDGSRLCHGAGPIPACAGEPRSRHAAAGLAGAYPRLRGGTRPARCLACRAEGLSPPARGNLGVGGCGRSMCGPIPACAGEPGRTPPAWRSRRAYPRLRGGTSAI